MDLVEATRHQAAACARLGSPMYADLLGRVAEDLVEGGPSAEVLAGHEDDPGPSALLLRLMGSVHRLVLERRAGALAASYPSVGGVYEPDTAWTEFRTLLAEQPGAVREWLDRPPQTNEVGRATVLMAGLLELDPRLPVRLFEIGSSGGLNLLADQFRYVWDGGALGPQNSPVVLDPAYSVVEPRQHAALTRVETPSILERTGSDVMPVDVRTPAGRLTLTAYTWPDQGPRLERLRGAFALAERERYDVRRQSAAALVDGIELTDGTTTVLWHSVMWQYLTADEQAHVTARITELGERATPTAAFGHVFLEPTRRTPGADHEFLAVLETWPAGSRRILGTSVGHGVPTTLE